MCIVKRLRGLFNKSKYCPNGQEHNFTYRFAKGGGRIKRCCLCGYEEKVD